MHAHTRAHGHARRYDGYRLTYMGYDFLALRALTARGHISGVGRQIGMGKESDIFEARLPCSHRGGAALCEGEEEPRRAARPHRHACEARARTATVVGRAQNRRALHSCARVRR